VTLRPSTGVDAKRSNDRTITDAERRKVVDAGVGDLVKNAKAVIKLAP
jgi:hypothetical protein